MKEDTLVMLIQRLADDCGCQVRFDLDNHTFYFWGEIGNQLMMIELFKKVGEEVL